MGCFHNKKVVRKSFLQKLDQASEDLKKLGLSKLKDPLNHLCLVKMGDKVLDHQITRRYFSNSYVVCEKNGNHSYDDFLEKIPLILDYLF